MTIAFREVGIGGVMRLTVQVSTQRRVRVARSRWEPLRQRVLEKS
ncbi:hypothetical protein [Dyella sp. A6]|nr:hypothetical protein [Dyella sp. A6]